jgi:ABC transport system ATP-binding/permease protein
MSEQILKALTQLFAIISKQDEGVSEAERDFVINFYLQELDRVTMREYLELYDKYSEYGVEDPEEEKKEESPVEDTPAAEGEVKKTKRTKVGDSMKVLKICRQQINPTLSQKQKVIVVFKLLEMLAADRKFSKQRLEIIDTIANVFKIERPERKLITSFVVEETSSAASLDNEDILIFDDEPPIEESKKKYIDSGELNGEIIFIHVKSVDLYFIRYTGTDEIILNGKVVARNAIVLFSQGSIIKTPKGAPLYYSDLVTRYSTDIQRANISFNAENIEFKFPNGALGLRGVSISESMGKLIGIMGASGAGKTTLLNVLAGLEKPSGGKVLINGYEVHDKEQQKNIEGVIGYIAQDDLLIEELTVYQNLYYNAKLCFKNLTEKEIDQKVIAVLASLGLDRIKDIVVGNVLNKKISGGQRKRLNIALELIREPAVLFVDEPTSGLSSRDSENVIDLLKELSLKGKLIYVVIHQPSSDIYKMFDKMVILDTGGYQIFYGNPVEAIMYFKKATKQVGADKGQCETCGNVNPEQLFNIVEARVVDEYGEFTNKRKITPVDWGEMFKQNFVLDKKPDINEKPPKALFIPSKPVQTMIFIIRDFLSKISNTQYMAINLLEAPFLAVLMASVIRFKDILGLGEYVFRYNDNVPAYILICIIISLFMGLSVSAEEIIKDRKILKRESFLNLSRTSYLASKLVILFGLSALQTMSFVLIGNFILGIEGLNMSYWAVLFSMSCFANVLGLNISSAFNSAITVYILIPLLLIPQMILSGGIFSFDKLNNSVMTKGLVPLVGDVWASRWAYEAIIVEQYRSNPYGKNFFKIEEERSIATYKTSFWVPKMEELVNNALAYKAEAKGNKKDSILLGIRKNLAVIKNELALYGGINKELAAEMKTLKVEKFLTSDAFNEEFATQLKEFLNKIKDFYNVKYLEANDKRDALIEKIENQKGKKVTVAELEARYQNESLEDVVKNMNIPDRITVDYEKQRIIQLVDPVFTKPFLVSSPLDYRTHLYSSQKHLFGKYFDTYWFNIGAIWFMTIFLYLTLYFEILKKIIDLFGKISFGKKD